MPTLIRILLISLAAGAVASGCGRASGPLPPPPKNAKALPWVNDQVTAATAGSTASFLLHFEDVNGNIAAAMEIYMNVKDPYSRSAFNTTVKTSKDGTALFENVPVGNYMLEFKDQAGRRSRLRVDLGKFTGKDAGKDAGTVEF